MLSIHYPDYSVGNPYQVLMFRALEEQGCTVLGYGGRSRSLAKRLILERPKADILHLHWIDRAVTQGSMLHALASMTLFYITLSAFRLQGRRIFWTVHNLTNHDKSRVALERFHARVVARFADRILVHGVSAKDPVIAALNCRPDKIAVVFHGNYDGAFPSKPFAEGHDGRRFLFFGQIKRYKGADVLARLFQTLEGPHRLHIAGKVSDPDLQAELEQLSAADPRISSDFSFVSDAELERLLEWADVIVLPYRDIFTSGSLLLALTAGRPVVAPRMGLIPEYVGEDAAFLYDPDAKDGLLEALKQASADNGLPERAAAARQHALRFAWSDIAGEIIELYRGEQP